MITHYLISASRDDDDDDDNSNNSNNNNNINNKKNFYNNNNFCVAPFPGAAQSDLQQQYNPLKINLQHLG